MIRLRFLLVTVVIVLVTQMALAQQFEVASIRPSERKTADVQISPVSLAMRGVSLHSSIRWAYGTGGKSLRVYEVVGGPSWVKSEVYDIVAKSDVPATQIEFRTMLQSLLKDRFNLELLRESKEVPVYVITNGNGRPKLTPSQDNGDRRSIMPQGRSLEFQNASLLDLADFLAELPAFDRPVVDKTGMEGRFDFKLALVESEAPDPAIIKAAINAFDISNYKFALEQIGLKLESQKALMSFISVVRAEKPTD
jgi:uncharacterized protein (TIGR03435 family)